MDQHLDQEQVAEFFGNKELRWYQVAARNGVADALERGNMRVLIVLPTGTGKTITIAASLSDDRIRQAIGVKEDRPLRVLFAAHMHVLLNQAEQTFADSNNVKIIPHSIFSDLPDTEWDVCVLDESHHEACASFQHQLEKIGDKPIIGLTATPDRADGCLIKFEEFIAPLSREDAVAQGYLAETTLHSFLDSADRDKVEITKSIIDNFSERFGQTMMFFRTKKEVKAIHNYLCQKGAKSVALLNQTSAQTQEVLHQFSRGEIQFIVNCNRINEGVDVVGCTDVYLGRQFGSYPQLNQVIGRASRPDSDCRVWELINPLSGRNLDTTVVVGTPRKHELVSKRNGSWLVRCFDYINNTNVFANL